MIVEGLIVTLNADGSPHMTAMGPRVESDDAQWFELRPFEGSTTLRNLLRVGEGVFHLTDDCELLARAALGKLDPLPMHRPASCVQSVIVPQACRWWEFVVETHEATAPRHQLRCRIVAQDSGAPFRGLNRAAHAILEAAILGTRVHLLPSQVIEEELGRLQTLIDKTAGNAQRATWNWLLQEIRQRMLDAHCKP